MWVNFVTSWRSQMMFSEQFEIIWILFEPNISHTCVLTGLSCFNLDYLVPENWKATISIRPHSVMSHPTTTTTTITVLTVLTAICVSNSCICCVEADLDICPLFLSSKPYISLFPFFFITLWLHHCIFITLSALTLFSWCIVVYINSLVTLNQAPWDLFEFTVTMKCCSSSRCTHAAASGLET